MRIQTARPVRVLLAVITSLVLMGAAAAQADAALIAKSGSTLTYTGGSEANDVNVSVDAGGHLIVSDSTTSSITTGASGCSSTSSSPPTVDCGVPSTTGVTGIVVNTADGGDSIAFGNQIPLASLVADGGPGDDTLTGGDNNETLKGGADEDTIYGNDGTDNLQGGSENDLIIANDSNAEQISCGAGTGDKVGADNADTINQCELDDTATALDVPSATTGGATGLSTSGGTVNGTVNPNAHATSFHVEYGTTTAYGNTTPTTSVGSDSADHAVNAALSGLQPTTTYHYRVVATTASTPGVAGEDQSFKTATPPAPLPIVTTGLAEQRCSLSSTLGHQSAILHGSWDAGGNSHGKVYFEFSGTGVYPQSLVQGYPPYPDTGYATSTITFDAPLGGVFGLFYLDNQVYYYRLVLSGFNGAPSTGGLVYGLWRSLTTHAGPNGTDSGLCGGYGSTAPASAAVTVGGPGVVTVPVPIQCPLGLKGCAVKTIALSSKKLSFGASSARKSKKKILELGSYKYTIKAGKRGKVKVAISKRGFKLLKRLHKLRAKVRITVRQGGKVVGKRTMKVTFKAKRK